jgi:hypothetical protein
MWGSDSEGIDLEGFGEVLNTNLSTLEDLFWASVIEARWRPHAETCNTVTSTVIVMQVGHTTTLDPVH